MFCNHDDEVNVYGSDPVPCPFCGFGAQEEPSTTEPEALGFDDSNEALRHALFETEPQTGSSELNSYW